MPTDVSEPAKQNQPVSKSRAGGDRWLTPRFFCAIAFLVLLLAAYFKPLVALATYAAGSELDSYIVLIPFISIYLIWTQQEKVSPDYAPDWIAGLSFLAVGLCLLTLAFSGQPFVAALSQNDYLTLTTFSFLCCLISGGFLFVGRKWMRSVIFPIAFLAFMIPLPDRVVDSLETASKLASAEAANLFFVLTGTPALRAGRTIFQLPGITIEVAQECSGIRSSWILIITSLLAAYLFLKSGWRRLILVLFVLPLGIIRNGFRILVISLLCIHIGPEMIHSPIHKRGGPLFFVLSLLPLFLLLWLLRRGDWKAKAPLPSRNPRTI